MILIIGGAYQGKRGYAMETYDLKQEQIFTCEGAEIDFTKPCIDGLEEFAYACAEQAIDPTDYFRQHREAWHDSVLICQDIFCGVVPLEAKHRKWRQLTGRLCQYLSGEAEQVIRIFCGLEQRLK